MILPNPRLENPALLIPNRKPVGPMEVDQEHRAAKGLFLALDFRGGLTQEISGSKALLPLTNTGGSAPVIGPGGLSFRPATANSQNTNAITFDGAWTDSLGRSTVYPYTVAFQFSVAESPNDEQGIFHIGSSNGSTCNLIYVSSSNNLVVSTGSWNAGEITHSLTLGVVYTAVVKFYTTSGNNNELWVNGQYIGLGYKGAPFMNNEGTAEIGRAFGSNAYGDGLNGNIYIFFAWDYAMPDALCQSLSGDLNQFLIPA